MVVMLRSLGIPARVVSGYAEGSYDPEMLMFTITERDAHTWVEVFFPGYGWVEFEPTAGESQLNRPSGIDPTDTIPYDDQFAAEGALTMPQDPFAEEMYNQSLENPMDQPFLESGAFSRRTLWVWALLTPVLLAVGGWLIWRTRVIGPTRFDPDLPPLLFERLQRWAQRLGLVVPLHHTPYEQASQLSQALPEARTPIQSITEGYVRYRFSRRPAGTWSLNQALNQSVVQSLGQGSGSTVNGAEPGPDTLITSWQSLEPVLWRAWLNKLAGFGLRAKSHPFSLVKQEPSKE
jgi:hypothetical protein